MRNLYTGYYLMVADGIMHGATLTASTFPVAWKVVVVAEGAAVVIRCVLR